MDRFRRAIPTEAEPLNFSKVAKYVEKMAKTNCISGYICTIVTSAGRYTAIIDTVDLYRHTTVVYLQSEATFIEVATNEIVEFMGRKRLVYKCHIEKCMYCSLCLVTKTRWEKRVTFPHSLPPLKRKLQNWPQLALRL